MTFVSHWLKILSLAISVCFVVTKLCPLPNVTDENYYFNKEKYILNIICYDVTSKFYVYNITSYCINGLWFPPLTNICKRRMKEQEYTNNFHKWPEFSIEHENWRENFKSFYKNNHKRLKRSPNVGKFEALKRHELVDKKISEGILETGIDPNTPGIVRVHPGGKAFLLCRVENLGTNSVMWFIGDKVLSIDTSIFVPDKRFFLSFDIETGTWILEINKVKMSDQGNYTCQVSNRPTIRHIVKLQVIPNGKPLLPSLKKKRRRRRKKNIRQDKQSLAIEELRQNLSTIWAEINDLKASLETHIKESDPQYYYDPTDHHHDDHHGDHHHDDHYHDHHHEGENSTAEGSLESGHDHAYDEHHSHHEYDHHHHHHDDYDHHLQHEGSENVHDPHYEDHHHQDQHQDHHHDDHHDDHHADHHAGGKDDQDEKDSNSKEEDDDDDDNSEENVVGKAKTGYYGRARNDSPQPDSQDHHDQGHHHYHQRRHQKEDFLKAHCHLLPNSEVPASNVTGHITITQNKDATGPLYFKIFMKGFEVSHEEGLGYVHGFHIHENEIQGQQCSSAGPHFNPYGKTHGAPYAVIRHVGDLGNIRVDDKGRFENRVISDDIVSFFGKSSIIGRSIVVHQKADDLGLGGDEESLKTGNAGARLACCTIESINIPKPIKPVIRFNG